MLSSQNRLTQQRDFSLVYASGSYATCDGVGLKFLKTNNPFTRTGFPVGKNYSKKAVERNRTRRILREATRANIPLLKPGYDIVLMIRPERKNLQLSEATIILKKLFTKANLFI